MKTFNVFFGLRLLGTVEASCLEKATQIAFQQYPNLELEVVERPIY